MLVCYLLGLTALWLLLRRRSERVRSLLLVGYNYLFAMGLCFWVQLPQGAGLPEGLRTLLLCLYQAPSALTFSADLELLSMFDRPEVIAIFLLMSLFTVRAVLVLFFRKALNHLSMSWRVRWSRQIYVVCGEEQDAQALINDIHGNVKRAAVVWIPLTAAEGEEPHLLSALCEDESVWDKLRPNREYHIVLLPDRYHSNVRRLQQLNEIGSRIPNLHVTAFLDNDLLRMEDFRLEHLDVFLVSQENLLVRGFMADNLPLAQLKRRGKGRVERGVYTPDGPFSLCMVGFGPLCREFLLTTYENTAFQTAAPDGRGLEALILDEPLAEAQNHFFRDCPQLAWEPGLTWLERGTDSPDFFRAVEERAGTLDQILVDTGDTQRTIDTTMRLLRLFRKLGLGDQHPQMVVVLRDEAEGSMALLAGEQDLLFQQANRIQFTYEKLILRAADRQAEAIHQRYRSGSLLTPAWRSLGSFTQDSNRAAVWDIPNKLLLAGDLTGLTNQERENVLWRLAQYEHRRWNAFHYARGWTVLPAAELTDEERDRCATKRISERRHACLVDWDELDGLPQKEPGLLKRYDYENVAELFF